MCGHAHTPLLCKHVTAGLMCFIFGFIVIASLAPHNVRVFIRFHRRISKAEFLIGFAKNAWVIFN